VIGVDKQSVPWNDHRHDVTSDLEKLLIVIWMANLQGSVALPAQGKTCTILRDLIGVTRAFVQDMKA
jgi:hypothetical protein